jgi:DNA-binding FadR family transcriptional regulator
MLESDLDDSRVSRAEALARRLEARILDGAVRAGERVGTKEELKTRFGVAVATVNEAIRLLQARGLVQVRPGPRGGVFASEPSPFVRLGHQVLALKHEGVRAADCLQVRDALEPAITVEAAAHCSPADAAALRENMRLLQAAAGDPTEFLRANWDLHRRIAEITPNRILRNLYVSLLDATESELGAVIPDSDFPGVVDGLLTLHRQVVAAIVAGDQELARIAADRHVLLTNGSLRTSA